MSTYTGATSSQGALIYAPPTKESLFKPLKRKPSRNLLQKCEKVGLVTRRLERAVQLVIKHNTTLQHIVRWREDGLTLEQIEHYLEIRDEYEFSMSIPLIKWYMEGAGFRFLDVGYEDVQSEGFGTIAPEIIVDFFQEVADRVGGTYPHHRIMHFIEEKLGGDVMAAFDLGIDRMDALVGAIDPRYAYHTMARLNEQDRRDIDYLLTQSQEGGDE